MPFTISHVAAVVPVYRPLARWRLFSAAAIGAMAPDFQMLLPGTTFARWETHSLGGLLNFCLPIGLLAYALTQLLIKPAFAEVLPDGAYVRLRAEHPAADLRPLSTWLYAAIAVLFGALTHLVWDAFTHENGRGVRFLPFLSDYGPQMAGHPLQIYRWLQYGSSIFGLAVIALALLLWLHHAPAPNSAPARRLGRGERLLWGLLYLIGPLAAFAFALAVAYSQLEQGYTLGGILYGIAILTLQAAVLSLLIVSGLIRLRLGR